jgi:hypothetical protein
LKSDRTHAKNGHRTGDEFERHAPTLAFRRPPKKRPAVDLTDPLNCRMLAR